MTFVTVTDICSPDELPDRVMAVPVLAVAFAADAAFVADADADADAVLPLLPLVPVVSTVCALQAAVTAAAASAPRTAVTPLCQGFGPCFWLLTDLLFRRR
jgi:hypothetical protein